MKVIIIGGGTAGSEVAWRLRQKNKEIEIVILEKGRHTQYSPCALPYLLAGEIKKVEDIFLFDADYYAFNKITLELGAEARKIDRSLKQVYYRQAGQDKVVTYDKLVLTLGGQAKRPLLPGLETGAHFTLKTIDDVQAIQKNIKAGERALIIGSGYIGMELADALVSQGLTVSLLEAQDRILPSTLDKEISSKIKDYMEEKGVKIVVNAQVGELSKGRALINDQRLDYDRLFVCCGLLPELKLAQSAGLECDESVVVDSSLRTTDPDIYAAGDFVRSINLADGRKLFSQLATAAVRQARVIAADIAGERSEIGPVLSASISKFGALAFGSCGLSQAYCAQNNIAVVSAFYAGQSKAEYHPEARAVFIKIIAQANGKIVGCQVAGFEEMAGRINLMSLAMQKQMTLTEFISMETCYNPGLAPIFEPLVLAAEICLKKLKCKNENA